MSHFDFLKAEFAPLHDPAVQAERFALSDPRTACFHARRALELTVDWLYTHDRTLTRPYQDQLNALIHEPTFRALVGPGLFNKARLLKDLGNLAVHSQKPIRQYDGVTAVRELFHFAFWVARTYARTARPADTLVFTQESLPKPTAAAVPAQTIAQLQKLEFFSQNPETIEGAENASISKRLFTSRLELMSYLENEPLEVGEAAQVPAPWGAEVPTAGVLLGDVKLTLAGEVAAMNVDNFIVRPQRLLVEKYGLPEAWNSLNQDARHELADRVAGLPTELESEPEEAKRFDLLIIRLQLAVMKKQKSFARWRDQVTALAGALLEMASIPMVRAQLPLIEELLSEPWWQDVTVPMLEVVRRRLRLLVPLIDKVKRAPVYTDFEDELGEETEIELTELSGTDTFERFRAKARSFLREHADMLAIHKLRTNTPLTKVDLEQLQTVLTRSGVGATEFVQQAADESHGLGLFVRCLVGLDREAANRAFAGFLSGQSLTADQIEFVSLIIDHLTEHGVMEPELLYESPFTDVNPQGPNGLFNAQQVTALIEVLGRVKSAAEAA